MDENQEDPSLGRHLLVLLKKDIARYFIFHHCGNDGLLKKAQKIDKLVFEEIQEFARTRICERRTRHILKNLHVGRGPKWF